MSTGRDLLAAVLAAPDDDEPRLVYADFLQERGDPRGELIVVQCKVARCEHEGRTLTAEYRALVERARELSQQQWAAFTKSPDRGLGVSWQRGLVHAISVQSLAQLEEHREFVESCPVKRLRVQQLGLADLHRLAAMPFAARLRSIVIGQSDSIAVDAQLALGAARAGGAADAVLWDERNGVAHDVVLPAIEEMHLWPANADKLDNVRRSDPPRLVELQCAGGLEFAGDAFEPFTRTELFARLTTFFAQGPSDRQTIAFLEGAGALTSLTANAVKPEQPGIAAAFVRSRALPTLEHLAFPCNTAMVHALDERAPRLRLYHDMGQLSREAVGALTAGTLPGRLERLDVDAAEPRSPSTPLVRAPFTRLLDLGLGNFGVGTELPDAPASLDTLTALRLYGCTIAPTIVPRIRARWPMVRIE